MFYLFHNLDKCLKFYLLLCNYSVLVGIKVSSLRTSRVARTIRIPIPVTLRF